MPPKSSCMPDWLAVMSGKCDVTLGWHTDRRQPHILMSGPGSPSTRWYEIDKRHLRGLTNCLDEKAKWTRPANTPQSIGFGEVQ